MVDSTFASPINFRPIEHGADVVIHSATKYLNGHHDVLAGVVCGPQPYIDEVRQKMMLWGQTPDPFALWLLERGLKTLDVRVQRANETAMRVAPVGGDARGDRAVHYPGLASHPDHALAREMLDGFGGMLALELAGGGDATARVLSHASGSSRTRPVSAAWTRWSASRATRRTPHMTSAERAPDRDPRRLPPPQHRPRGSGRPDRRSRAGAEVSRCPVSCDSTTSPRSIRAPASPCDDVSFDVNKGEFVFLTGASGAGKSTILKLIYFAERPTARRRAR